MTLKGRIKEYLTIQPEPKDSNMQALHRIILRVMPMEFVQEIRAYLEAN